MSPETLLLVFLAFGLGGVLKGATGAGAPFLAVPIMSILVDVPFAVAVFLLPNLASNGWQVFRYRRDFPGRGFALSFALAAMAGAGFGTVMLARLDSAILTKTLAIVVLGYVFFRLRNPRWHLAQATARKIVIPIGALGGIFQGAVVLSAPISVSFMNAVGFDRRQFIAVMSLYFLAMAVVQLPTQLALGILTPERVLYGLIAILPLVLGMPIGDLLGRRISRQAFDRVIMAILVLLAVRLLF